MKRTLVPRAPCPVPDISESDDYIAVPEKQELKLGQNLVWDFVVDEIPGLSDQVRQIFRKKGAYQNYRNFLRKLKLLNKWHAFESDRTEAAIRRWCEENGIQING